MADRPKASPRNISSYERDEYFTKKADEAATIDGGGSDTTTFLKDAQSDDDPMGIDEIIDPYPEDDDHDSNSRSSGDVVAEAGEEMMLLPFLADIGPPRPRVAMNACDLRTRTSMATVMTRRVVMVMYDVSYHNMVCSRFTWGYIGIKYVKSAEAPAISLAP